MAQASLSEVTPEGFPLDPGLLKEGLILLAGFAGGIALDVVKDLIKDRIKKLIEKKLAKKQESVEQKSLPAVEIVIIEQPGRPFIVVKEQE